MKLRDRYYRLTHFEYWPFWAFYFPVFLIWPWLSLKGKSLVFFTASNPFIPLGGCIEESKTLILRQLPQEFIPRWCPFDSSENLNQLESSLKNASLSFPLVAKPDVGERGDFIKIIHSSQELLTYAQNLKRPYLVQDFITDSFEAGVMVIKDPLSGLTRVTSVVTKGFLSVHGDGKSSLEELVSKIPRARFQWARLIELGWDPKVIPKENEEIILEKIGNHKRGTTFLNGNHLITQEVIDTASKIASQTPGFFFGRFDLKAPTDQEFKLGRDWKIMELNGAFSEPGHIYDPKNNLLSAWRDLVIHWIELADVSSKSPQPPSSLLSFIKVWLQYRQRS